MAIKAMVPARKLFARDQQVLIVVLYPGGKCFTQANGFKIGERISTSNIVLGVPGQVISVSAGHIV
jgi:hypothetical protein